ncbi:family 16 glycoside hydrolase [Rhodopirellula sp. JC639]|uniref:family 16 glycoside hydrolase n=1 Tax=Stieleria mannarensis TaxID=2755585 RepID=UPI0015FEED50|nr:family 16 glycoside hydrolase [Rhodopirellula sp. JC639]
MIIVDDLNDLPLSPDGKPRIKTPNTQRIRISSHVRVQGNRVVGTLANVPPAQSNLEGNAVPFDSGNWNRYRIRVVDGRCRVWINHRLHSDVVKTSDKDVGVIGFDFPGVDEPTLSVRASRVRRLTFN